MDSILSAPYTGGVYKSHQRNPFWGRDQILREYFECTGESGICGWIDVFGDFGDSDGFVLHGPSQGEGSPVCTWAMRSLLNLA